MSEPTAPAPRLLSVMCEFTRPETLARVAQCSKAAHTVIVPLLKQKKENREEMHAMMLRLFPGIQDLPDHSTQVDTSLYHTLLDTFFGPECQTARLPVQVSFNVGTYLSLIGQFTDAILMENFVVELQTAKGRRKIQRAIDDWRVAVEMNTNDIQRRTGLACLDNLERVVRGDFVVRFDRICSGCQWRPNC
jgi:hypothetical protein